MELMDTANKIRTAPTECSGYRWTILALLFVATTINYLDRTVLSVAVKDIKETLQLSDIQYGYVLTAFQLMYTVGFLAAGRIIDRLGTRLGYLLSILAWSIAGSLTGLSNSALSLSFWRGMLGITESGNFPAAIKSVSEWFPPRQRAFATSLFNSGPSVALIVGPPIIAVLTLTTGWRWAFVIVASSGFILAGLWPFIYKLPAHLTTQSEQPALANSHKVRWSDLLRHRQTYGIMIGKFCTDPVWWFYIFWLPNYLYDKRGFDIKGIAIAVPLIYIVAIILGNIAGWAPGFLIARGSPVQKARKTVMLVCAMCMPISAMAVFAPNPWLAIALVSLACSAHNGWSANIFTLSSDCFPSRAVGSITGLVGFAGGLGGIIIASLAPGYIVTYFGYVPVFILMGVLHPFALVCIHLLLRRSKPIEM
jgi:ACS family hexuronate transporter-like MFS transporter